MNQQRNRLSIALIVCGLVVPVIGGIVELQTRSFPSSAAVAAPVIFPLSMVVGLILIGAGLSMRFTAFRDFVGRYWFPLALVALALLATPALVLFILNFIGQDAAINAWLRESFNLTYHLPIPLWGGLILLLMPLAIVLLYFLKLKRKALQVPSTFLWRKSIEDLHVNSLLQWLRQNVLLLLQLLTLLFFFLAVLTFRSYGEGGASKRYILLIDNSASMLAADLGMSRLDWAKQQALREIDAAGDNDSGMVIEFNSSAITRQSFTSNKDVLRQAVRSIEPTQRSTRVDDALKLASSLANPTRTTEDVAVRPVDPEPGKERTYAAVEGAAAIPTEVHLFSDGRFPDGTDFQRGTLDLHFHSAGKAGADQVDNVAIVGLRATRDDDNPGKLRVFVRVLNYRARPVEAQVQVTVQPTGQQDKSIYERTLLAELRVVHQEKDGERVIVRDLPGEAATSIEMDDPVDAIVHARLVNVKDQFPLDDEAWLALGVVRKARVLIVGKDNDVLDRFFKDNLAVQQVASVARQEPASLATAAYLDPARNGDYDLVIFDRCTPRTLEEMPRSNTFFIGALPPSTTAALKKVESPFVLDWQARHPLLRYLVSLQDIGIAESWLVTKKDLPDRTPILIEGQRESALLYALTRQSFTDLVMTFPLLNDEGKWNSDWPLKPGFPLFLTNVLKGLGYIKDAVEEEPTQPGQMKVLRPDVAVDRIVVTAPGGGTKALDRGQRADFSFADTERVGIYSVSWGGQRQRSFAVNLLDAEESNLQPRTDIQIGVEQFTSGAARGQPRDLWPWVILAAIGLLLLEWYVYNRRVYI